MDLPPQNLKKTSKTLPLDFQPVCFYASIVFQLHFLNGLLAHKRKQSNLSHFLNCFNFSLLSVHPINPKNHFNHFQNFFFLSTVKKALGHLRSIVFFASKNHYVIMFTCFGLGCSSKCHSFEKKCERCLMGSWIMLSIG
jgi:hypothetical protein